LIELKSSEEIQLIREACNIVAQTLKMLKPMIQPGVTTKKLDEAAEEYVRSHGAIPAFKGYRISKAEVPFPGTLCTSIDDEVVHGIPGSRVLREGEILSVDIGTKKDGFFGDAAWTYAVGLISPKKQELMNVTREALAKGIEASVVGNCIHDISYAIQQHVESNGFSVVRDLVGHGVGKKLHEEPAIPNFGKPGTGAQIQNGMTLAIEPMVNEGSWRVSFGKDGWTVRTKDGKPSAHFEHTIAIIDGTAEILTK
jgi:methionyl aminopeptidase